MFQQDGALNPWCGREKENGGSGSLKQGRGARCASRALSLHGLGDGPLWDGERGARREAQGAEGGWRV